VSKALEEARKKIVATKEGGAITGEERIREHLDELYGALNGWEGRPAKYQTDRIEALRRELADVGKEVDTIVTRDVAPIDVELKARKLDPFPTGSGPQAEIDEPADPAALACVRSRGADCAGLEREAATRTRD